MLPSEVDVINSRVTAEITELGVYAALMTVVITDVEDGDSELAELPHSFELLQNYPNPFNPTTTISYRLSKPSHVKIVIFNVNGQLVRTLLDAQKPAGSYTISWDGKNATDRSVATGVYLYRFQAGDFVVTKKMLLMK